MTMSTDFPVSERHAQLIFFDPGSTTGIVALSIRPRWLAGGGEPSWLGLGKAITTSWFAQVGRDARIVGPDGRAKLPPRGQAVIDPQPASRKAAAALSGALGAEIEATRQCEALLDQWQDAAWGYESFQPMLNVPGGADYLSPVRIAERLVYVELVYGERRRMPFVQSASTAKTTATDERLRAAGMYRAGLPHATDAARHALTFLRRCRQDEALRSMAWPRIFRAAAA